MHKGAIKRILGPRFASVPITLARRQVTTRAMSKSLGQNFNAAGIGLFMQILGVSRLGPGVHLMGVTVERE